MQLRGPRETGAPLHPRGAALTDLAAWLDWASAPATVVGLLTFVVSALDLLVVRLSAFFKSNTLLPPEHEGMIIRALKGVQTICRVALGGFSVFRNRR